MGLGSQRRPPAPALLFFLTASSESRNTYDDPAAAETAPAREEGGHSCCPCPALWLCGSPGSLEMAGQKDDPEENGRGSEDQG